jgi:hypothetical protein
MDDQGQRALHAIEQNLTREDPAFVARMRVGRTPDARFPTISALCASLYILIPLGALLFGWPGVVIILDVFAVAIAAVLIHRYRHRRA